MKVGHSQSQELTAASTEATTRSAYHLQGISPQRSKHGLHILGWKPQNPSAVHVTRQPICKPHNRTSRALVFTAGTLETPPQYIEDAAYMEVSQLQHASLAMALCPLKA